MGRRSLDLLSIRVAAPARANPPTTARLLAQRADAGRSTPAGFDRRIRDELAPWELVIGAAGIEAK